MTDQVGVLEAEDSTQESRGDGRLDSKYIFE